MKTTLRDQLLLHEGLRLFPYTDTAGKLTIGVGRNLTDNGLSREEALLLLDHDIVTAITECAQFPWFAGLSDIRQRVIVDMMFNLGPARFKHFTAMITAVATGDYEAAAEQMLKSLWAKQVGQRAKTLAAMMRTGTV